MDNSLETLREMLKEKIHYHLKSQVCFLEALNKDAAIHGSNWEKYTKKVLENFQQIAQIFGIKLQTTEEIIEEHEQITLLENIWQLDPDKDAIRT